MGTFIPPEPPFEPGEPTPPPSLMVPAVPPQVGFGSPYVPADAENRDRILDWWRAWWRRVFFPWIAAFIAYWNAQWDRLATYINTWIAAADDYITDHAVSGYSWRTTATTINPTVGLTTAVAFTGVDQEHRPLIAGDLVSDESYTKTFGIITALIDATHATVTTIGFLSGLNGHGWWRTATPIATGGGTTNVILTAAPGRPPQILDFVMDSTSAVVYGVISAITDDTHVTVVQLGVLQGPQGIQGIQGIQGVPGVVQSIVAGAFITVDNTDPANPVITGTSGGGGVDSVVAGTNVTVDDTDPANPIVNATGGGGGGVESVVAGDNVTVDSTDPANPIVSVAPGEAVVQSIGAGDHITVDSTDPANPTVSAVDLVQSIVAGDNLTVDNTDPYHPVVSGTGVVESVVAGAHVTIDSTDPANPIVTATNGGGVVETIVAGTNVDVDDSDPANPIISATGGGTVDSIVAGANVTIDSSDPANPIVSALDGGGGNVAMGDYPGGTFIAYEPTGDPDVSNATIYDHDLDAGGVISINGGTSQGAGIFGMLVDSFGVRINGQLTFGHLTDDPDTLLAGMVWWDSDAGELKCYDGTSVKTVTLS